MFFCFVFSQGWDKSPWSLLAFLLVLLVNSTNSRPFLCFFLWHFCQSGSECSRPEWGWARFALKCASSKASLHTHAGLSTKGRSIHCPIWDPFPTVTNFLVWIFRKVAKIVQNSQIPFIQLVLLLTFFWYNTINYRLQNSPAFPRMSFFLFQYPTWDPTLCVVVRGP